MAKSVLESKTIKLKSIEEIEKKHGKGNVYKFSDKPAPDIPVISTGSMKLDSALGIGGIPCGRITEIFGAESSGKSGICLQIAAECQKSGGRVAYVDSEHALDINYAQLLGVDVDELFISQPDTAQATFSIIEELAKHGEFNLIIVDSVAALVTEQEMNGDFGDSNVGVLARLMSQACRKLTPLISKNNVALVFVNQIREMIGVMFGPSTTTPGGRALKFFSSVRIETSSSTQIKDGDVIVGRTMKNKIVKNKLAPPFLTSDNEIYYGKNWLRFNEIMDLGTELKIIEKTGAWFTYNGEKIMGKDKFRSYLIDNPEVSSEIEAKIRTELGVA